MRSFLHNVGISAVKLAGMVALMFALAAQPLMATPAPGGVVIRNIAETTYYNTALGFVETVFSNAVEAEVAIVPAVEINGTSDLLLTRGAFAQYYFNVLNTGNVSLQLLMSIEDTLGAALTTGGRFVFDLNGNGIIDGAEGDMDITGPFSIEAGARLQLIYEFRVSIDATPGDTMSSALVVTATVEGGEPVVVRVTGSALGLTRIVSSALELEKQQMISETDSGVRITYMLHLRNNSEGNVSAYNEIEGQALRIDGAVRSGVLLRDKIPLNTVFYGISETAGLVPLYHLRGQPDYSFQSSQPVRIEEIDAVAFFKDGDYPVGRSSDPSFQVNIPRELGNVTVFNTAEAYLDEAEFSAKVASNTTIYTRDETLTGTLIFVDPETGEEQEFGHPDTDSRLRLTAAGCNLTRDIDRTNVTVRSFLTGDVETIVAIETAANSGIFITTALPLVRMDMPLPGDGVMATNQGDRLFGSAVCAGTLLEDDLAINPGNFLFNSISNAPIGGVTIALIDVVTGTEQERTLTDDRGFFTFLSAPAGRYRYEVVNAPAWNHPSVRLSFVGFGRQVTEAGYGADFGHGGGPVFVSDIPVDPHYGAPLSLLKTADRTSVGNGEFVVYTLTFGNNMDQGLVNAEVLDRAPYGVTYVPGSAALNGEPLADPAMDGSGDMTYYLGDLEPLSTHELSYVMHFTAAAREGRNENTALLSGRQAGTGTPRQSAPARAVVQLTNAGGVFAREGTVIGSVFMDCDGDGIRGNLSEPGVPGVRIITQEGLSVVTDIDGKYSLFGLRPVTHAFLVQSETLPVNTQVAVTRTNDLRGGGSRLVPLKRGELRAEHFAVAACSPEAFKEIADRRAIFEGRDNRESLTAADLPMAGQRRPNRSSRDEAGIATTAQVTPAMIAKRRAELEEAETLAEKAELAAQRQTLGNLIKSIDAAPGFIDFEDGQTVTRRAQNIRVKGPADQTLSLLLNGVELGPERVGERTNLAAKNVQAAEFVAVNLSAGQNRLTLVGKDGFGIERMRKEITLIAPGKPAKLELILPKTASANPVSVVPVVVRVLDARGLPVPASGTVTLRAQRSGWDVTDIRTGTPGVQAYLDNGEATFGLIPPQVSGPDRITVSGAFGSVEATITFTPDLNERIIIGVIEGAIALGDGTSTGAVLEPDRLNSFENTITGLRGELYLKGVIRGDALLTLRYSSDRDTEDRLFRDIRGDENYPVYGDNSERGADAQSSTNLFVKVEKGRSYVLYGDIAIEPESTAFKLGGQRRVATGAKAHWENDKVSVTVFGARTAQEQMTQEIRGRGVSGPYDLDLGGYVEGSERVEILVRDEEGDDILSATPMRRGTDYILDFFRNTITFDAPVRQFDADGNPVSIRVTYETEQEGAERYGLYGGEVNYALGDQTTIGARAVHADAPIGSPARERLQSGYIRHEDALGGIWEAEAARSEDNVGVVDGAARLSYDIQNTTDRFSIELIHTGKNFLTHGGLARAGTDQLRLTYAHKIDRKSDIVIGAEYVRDRNDGSRRLTMDALYSRQFNKHFRGDIGVEVRNTRIAGETDTENSLLLGAHWTPKGRPDTVIKARLRYPIGGADRPAELTLRTYREPTNGWRSYNEVELTINDGAVLSRARIGFSYNLNEWLSGRTEMTRGIGETDTVYNQGMSATWQVNKVTSFSFDIEHARRMESGEHDLTSVAVGAKWGTADGDWVGDADFDTTFEDTGRTHYASFGLAGRLTPDLTFLGRSRIAIDRRNGADDRRVRTRAGLAYRPISNPRFEALAWYEHRLEEQQNRSETHMWSVDASYEINQDLRVNGKYAGQVQEISLTNGVGTKATTQLLQAGVNYEFSDDRFELGVNAARLWDNLGNATNGLGAEFGFSPRRGTLLAIGYNRAEGQVAGQSALYQEGLYLRFKLLLDNSLWDQLDGFLGN
ncbi:conserved repeat domain-containing protein [Sulfitobacter brevis]|uniref:Conserved repeat domain-containing protein n=1 Tax=Sulfitobacter brevis TaxID=74348 RepID=A0A1I2EUW8_9RHOB|nr:DUF11 domain-containing protein [Sulfitobacter brevis]SFE96609.1 conserved repeat domain-containing protein [Sulfitobacter brevis]